MRFIAVDLELNQPSNKIIQIGAVAWDTDHDLLAIFNTFVDPGEELGWDHVLNTGQTLGELLPAGWRVMWDKNKVPAKDALVDFWKWRADIEVGKKFVQWGTGDMSIICAESREHGVRYPRHLKTLDAKQLYQFLWQSNTKGGSGLSSACKSMGLGGPARAHDAYSDAVATAEIFLKMHNEVQAVQKMKEYLT